MGYTGSWIKYFIIDVWHYYQYALDSVYTRVLNMPGLGMALITFFITDLWQSSEYATSSDYTSFT